MGGRWRGRGVSPICGCDGPASRRGASVCTVRQNGCFTARLGCDSAAAASPTPAVVLRGGTHYIEETLLVTPEHSGLHLIGYPGESSVVSGGVELKGLEWTSA